MSIMERFQTVIILISIGIGLLLGQITLVEQHAQLFIIPFLLLMLYGLFLTVPLKNVKEAFKNKRFLAYSTIINFVWTPILAWGLGAIFLAEQPLLWLGFILLLVTPCTDWYLIFTSMAKGNISLSTSILPVNFILQVILLPVYLFIFSGTMESVALSTIVESVLLVLCLPFLLVGLTRYLFKRKQAFLATKAIPFLASSQIIFLSLAIMAMFASQGTYLLDNLEVIYFILIPLLLFFMINFIVAQALGKAAKFNYADTASLNLTITARNSPIALAIVITAFPEQPFIALALVIGPLIELPVLAIVSQLLLSIRKRASS